MTRTERARFTLEALGKVIARPETELDYKSEYELIVAVILSAQCTDARVNMVTPDVFARWPTFATMADAEPVEVAAVIGSISYPNNKSRHLVRMASQVVEDHGGQLPRSMNMLLKLPGVGRKTAQVVASVAFNDQSALPVDTHVFRVAKPDRAHRESRHTTKGGEGTQGCLAQGDVGDSPPFIDLARPVYMHSTESCM